MPFEFKKLDISDVVLIQPKFFIDDRGFFAEIYKSSDFKTQGIPSNFSQVNYSKSKKNVLRGLHYQLNPKGQDKLISVLQGEILDVVVDIRKGSPSYGQWVGERLSQENKRMLYVPIGFAHGFCVLSEEAEIMYYCSEEYAPDHERSIIWNDASINIAWPIERPELSARDSLAKPLELAENNFIYRKTSM